ncbi:hypothetical protein ACMYYO_05090 [Dermacoccaceae bacterium W4C1]
MLSLTVLTRDGGRDRRELADGEQLIFGREGGDAGTVAVSTSQRVSRTAFALRAEPGGLARLRCTQRGGTVEVNREDGRNAATLEDGEEGLFRAPLRITLHTTSGAHVTIVVSANQPPTARRPAGDDPSSTVVTGWSLARLQNPPAGEDWCVAAALAAVLLRRGRQQDPNYTVPRGVLLRACGQWLGAPKSEGWLASKFRQAGEAFAVQFGSSPSHQLAEYVLSAHLLNEAGLRAVDAELERRRAG